MITQNARNLYANHIARKGPEWRKLADNIRSGGLPTLWVEPALKAIDEALRFGPQEAGDGDRIVLE